jgi:SM-20-related protein
MSVSPLQRPPPIALRHGLLPEAELDALFDWAVAQEALYVASNLGNGAVDLERRNSLGFPRDRVPPWRDAMVARLTALLPELCTELGLAPFELHRFEFDALAYGDGAFFRRHIDTLAGAIGEHSPDERILTAVYYFHREPQGFSGGELRLSPVAHNPAAVRDIAPHRNMLVAFPSWAPHEVLPVRCPSGKFADSRFAINFWARRRRVR